MTSEKTKLYYREYFRTMKGRLMKMYCGLKCRNRKVLRTDRPGFSEIDFTLEEYSKHMLNNTNFPEIFKKWEKSGYQSRKSPSSDRIDNNLGYTLSNIQCLTTHENCQKNINNSTPICSVPNCEYGQNKVTRGMCKIHYCRKYRQEVRNPTGFLSPETRRRIPKKLTPLSPHLEVNDMEKRKICKYPNCGKLACRRGINASGNKTYRAWCKFHTSRLGKKDRLKSNKTTPMNTPSQNEEVVRAACIAANPRIREYHGRCMNCGYGFDFCRCIPKRKESYEDRKIGLADVLLAIRGANVRKSIQWDEHVKIVMAVVGHHTGKPGNHWNLLKDDLRDQSPETLAFLASLLLEKK